MDARSVSSMSQPQIRKDTIRAFSEGDFPVLINCEVLTEGTDIPQVSILCLFERVQADFRSIVSYLLVRRRVRIYLLRWYVLFLPCYRIKLISLKVGRGLRLCPSTGKVDCYLIDIVDNVSRSNGMLVSPTLWGLSHDDMIPDQREKGEARENMDDEEGSIGLGASERDKNRMKVSYIDQDDPFRLAKKGDSPLAMMSHNSWVGFSCLGSEVELTVRCFAGKIDISWNLWVSLSPHCLLGAELM